MTKNIAGAILDTLKEKAGCRFDKDLANLLEVTQNDIGNWRRRGDIPKNYKDRIIKYYYTNDIELDSLLSQDTVSIDTDGFTGSTSPSSEYNKGDNNMERNSMNIDAKEELVYKNRLITYQSKEIDILKNKLRESEAENRIIKIDNEYEDCIPDFETVVQMRNVVSTKSLERNIVSVDNVEPFADALCIDPHKLAKDYYCFGQWFKNNDHPVDQLVDEESLATLKSATDGIPKQAKLFKFTFGAFYLKFSILYHYKDNFAMTKTYCKVNWSLNPIIESKTVILHHGKLKNLITKEQQS